MLKSLNFLENAAAVSVFGIIVVVSFLTTVALSPIPIDNNNRVAGANEADILTNLQELNYLDTSPVDGQVETQLLRVDPTTQLLELQIPANLGFERFSALVIENPNAADVILQVSAQVSPEVTNSLYLYVEDDLNSYRVHGSGVEDRVIEFVVPAKGNIALHVAIESVHGIAFLTSATLQFSL